MENPEGSKITKPAEEKPTLYIAEDQQEIRSGLKRAFQGTFQIKEYENGLDVLVAIINAVRGETRDIVINMITDNGMPQMKGLDLLNKLLEITSITVVFHIILYSADDPEIMNQEVDALRVKFQAINPANQLEFVPKATTARNLPTIFQTMQAANNPDVEASREETIPAA